MSNASPTLAQPLAERPEVNKWLVAATVLFGTFMAVLDANVVNVALPHMRGTFAQDLSAITWVVTSYSIAQIIMLTMAGWWSALLGRKRLYFLSIVLFTIGSVLCGFAHTFQQMILYRVIQGIGGGALIPTSLAILRETFPPREQGMAMAIYGVGVTLAPAIGPTIGGWLTDNFSWAWIFFINVPFGLIGLYMISAFLHDPPYMKRGLKSIDWPGVILLTIAMISMQIVLERGQENNWFDSSMIVAFTAVCLFSAIMLVWWELRTNEPIINLRLLKNVPLASGSTISLIFGIALFGTTFILAQFTQQLLGYPALEAGLVLMPRAFALMLFMPVAGLLYRYVDSRALIIGGILIICWSYFDLAQLSLDADFWDLVPILVLMGIGMPFLFVTTSTVSLGTIPKVDMTHASSIFSLAQRVGGNIGYALVATLVARGQQIHRAHLVGNVNPFNPAYVQGHHKMAAALQHAGLNPAAVDTVSTGIVNGMINRQAAMLSYNDLSMTMGIMFIFTVIFVFFLPSGTKLSKLPHPGELAPE